MNTKKLFPVLMLVVLSVFSNCAENNPNKNTVKENPEKNITDKSICDLLSKEEAGKIMSVTFEESTSILNTIDPSAGSYVSQCAYYTNNGMQHVAVLVRHFKGTTFPQTAEEFLSASKTGDAEIDAEMDKALKNYIKVQGLGDAAFFYSLWESNSLVVHWNKSYEMIISMYDFNLDPLTVEKIKQLAKEVMKKF